MSLTLVMASLAAWTMVVGGGSFWLGKRGISGVQTDVSTLKADISAIKTKLAA